MTPLAPLSIPLPTIKLPSDKTSRRIINAARDLIAMHGFRRTSMDDIAAAATVGRATLFRRFTNRDALIRAVIFGELQRILDRFDAETEAIDDPSEYIVAGFLIILREVHDNDLLRRVLVTDAERVLPLLTVDADAAMQLGYAFARQALTRARQAGIELTADEAVLAELLTRIAQSFALTPETVFPLDDAVALERIARATLVPLILKDPPVAT